jgi:mono/diheme cytochrome c family protein
MIRSLTLLLSISFGVAQATPGESLFTTHCSACHDTGGAGVPGIAPPLAHALSKHVTSGYAKDYFSSLLIVGMKGPLKVDDQIYHGVMPAQGALNNEELAHIADYVLNTLNAAPAILVLDPSDFENARHKNLAPEAVYQLRKKVLQ